MGRLTLRARRLLARGINYRNPAYANRTFLGTGPRGIRTAGPLQLLSKSIATQPSFGIVVAGASTPLSVGVVSTTVTVNSATSAGSAATSTYKEVYDAIQASAVATALIHTSLIAGADASAVVSASAVSALAP